MTSETRLDEFLSEPWSLHGMWRMGLARWLRSNSAFSLLHEIMVRLQMAVVCYASRHPSGAEVDRKEARRASDDDD